ncbi:MAG: glutamyl-tRNA reductase [Halorhabdus sp.]
MTRGPAVVSGISVAHQHASVETIDAASAESQRQAVMELLDRPAVAEAFVLQTCNRAERYVVTDEPDIGRDALRDSIDGVSNDALVEMEHEASVRHLLRVAAGLESLVPGEDQILGQVRDAYQDARAVDGLGPVFEEAIPKAIHVGERARTETAINDGVVSLGSAAVELARRECELDSATALVVGAGEIATLAAKALDTRTDIDQLIVANRTPDNAKRVVSAVSVPGNAIGLDGLRSAIERATIVISATASPAPVVGIDAFEGHETVVVDIGQPRDVPPEADAVEGVDRFDLDDLESVTAETRASRESAAETVETIVETEFEHLLTRFKRTRADDVISSMYEGAERIKAKELQDAFRRLDLDAEEREVIEAMADALVNQLLAAPTESLRDAAEEDDWTTINAALRLFDPQFDDTGGPVSPNAAEKDIRERLSTIADDD